MSFKEKATEASWIDLLLNISPGKTASFPVVTNIDNLNFHQVSVDADATATSYNLVPASHVLIS